MHVYFDVVKILDAVGLPVIAEPPSNNESLLESVRELRRLADVVTVSGLCEVEEI